MHEKLGVAEELFAAWHIDFYLAQKMNVILPTITFVVRGAHNVELTKGSAN